MKTHIGMTKTKKITTTDTTPSSMVDEEVPSMYWDDNEDSEGYKEDGKCCYYNE